MAYKGRRLSPVSMAQADESQWLPLDKMPVHRRLTPQQCWYSFSQPESSWGKQDKVYCPSTQHSGQTGNQTRGFSITSPTPYHWPVLPKHILYYIYNTLILPHLLYITALQFGVVRVQPLLIKCIYFRNVWQGIFVMLPIIIIGVRGNFY